MQPELFFDVPYPDRSSRLTVFFRGLLVIPNAIGLIFVAIFMWFATALAWLAIMITGRHPRGLWDFHMLVLRWAANLTVYANYLRDEYPPFGSGSYPVQFELAYPERLSRLKTFFKPILLIPHMIALPILLNLASFLSVFAWIVIIITGRYPQGLFGFIVGVTRWQMRVAAYSHFLTDAYPPFSLDNTPGAGSGGGGGAAALAEPVAAGRF